MLTTQFKVLYREFLFRMVDRELLAAHAQGDANNLLGRFAAILIWSSIPFAMVGLGLGNPDVPRATALISAWGMEHAVIATTMLVAGLFAVLSWDSTFPDRRDVLVLAPLPVKAGIIFLSKAASLAVALGLTVALFNGAPGVAFPFALAPAGANMFDMIFSVQLYRGLAGYWITMLAAGTFVLFCVLCVQGIAAQLPRAVFLRLSSVLQIATLCLSVGVYFLQPSLTSPEALNAGANQRLLAWLPSYWFLGLFQELCGFASGPAQAAMTGLAARAWAGLAVGAMGAAAAFLLSYFRTIRKIVEEPDIAPGARGATWLPQFGNAFQTAIVQFSIRTVARSRQHRVILSFYSGLGFAILILFLKTPISEKLRTVPAIDSWQQAVLPVLASTIVVLCFWTLGIRASFAIPLELRANWIFRITPLPGQAESLAASRRAVYAIALVPLWVASALLLLWLWPWLPALEHLLVLGFFGITLAELLLYDFRKIPFTCSYLPGKSNLHIIYVLCLVLGFNALYGVVVLERRALSDAVVYVEMVAVLAAFAALAWRRTEWQAGSERRGLLFDEQRRPEIESLGLYRDGFIPMDSA